MNWTIRHITPQADAGAKEQVVRFSDRVYAEATRSRLTAPWGDEVFGVAAAFQGERCLGTTSYTISPHGLGILSQVFTDVEFRGQGIARRLIGAALEALREREARAVYLGAGMEWVRRLYRSFGFDFVGAMGERHAFKLTLQDSGRDAVLFRAHQRVSPRALDRHDQGDLSALFNARHDCLVKHYQLSCYLGSHFEGEFYELQRLQLERPGFQGLVLAGEETLLGLATVVPYARRHETHRGIIDILVHPGYAAQAAGMIATLHQQTDLETLVAYTGVGDTARRAMLKAAGYQVTGTLSRCLRIGAQTYDLLAWERRLR